MERKIIAAFAPEGVTVNPAHPHDEYESLKHGFIWNQRMGMDVFKSIPPQAPLIVAVAVWQYSYHVLAGLRDHQGPILTIANWSGQWLHWQQPTGGEDEQPCPDEVWKQIKTARHPSALGKPPAYYAVLMLDGDRLVVKREPATAAPLTPVFPDGFSSPGGWVLLRRDAAGRVTGFSVNQERVWDLRFTRQP